jgi:periplasmic divalent cation tolerance protein
MMQPALAPPVYVEVVVTASDDDVLTKIIDTLVEERLAAYGYTTTPVQAVYHWDGEVRTETHARGILHTRATLVSDIIDRLDNDHPGAMRSVVATQLVDGRSNYLQWVAHETAANIDHHAAAKRRRADRREERSHWSWIR